MATVLTWYIRFLAMNDDFLMHAIDVYNKGGLQPNARLALEIIDGCDGPGDRVVGSDFELGVAA